MTEKTFTAADVSRIVQERLRNAKTPAALVDMCMEALRRCDELEQRIDGLERNQQR